MSLDTKLQKVLENARNLAEKGKPFHIGDLLSSAQECAEIIGKDISAQVTEIERLGYENAVPIKLKNAVELAERGMVNEMSGFLLVAQDCAEVIGEDISAQVAKIERLGYENAIPINLENAKISAEKGKSFQMKDLLSSAQEYAEIIGKEISAQVTEIERQGYGNAMAANLKRARKFAENGNLGVMECFLLVAQEDAQHIGEDISVQLVEIEGIGNTKVSKISFAKSLVLDEEIKEIGIENYLSTARICTPIVDRDTSGFNSYNDAIKANLREAKTLAQTGKANLMEIYLLNAKVYSNVVDINISRQISEIKLMGYENAIPIMLAKAKNYAEVNMSSMMDTYLLIAEHHNRMLCYHNIYKDISEQVSGIRGLIQK